MSSSLRRLSVIAVLVALAAVLLSIPELKINALGGTFVRGNDHTFLGLSLGLDLQGGTHLVYVARPDEGRDVTIDDMEGVRRIIESRVNEFGVSEPIVQLLGTPPDRVMVQLPGLSGASITVTFAGDPVSAEALQEFFVEDLGRPDAEVTQNDNGSLTVHLDDLLGELLNESGEIQRRAEADQFKEKVEARFPIVMTIAYDPEFIPISPADPAPAEAAAEDGASDAAEPEPEFETIWPSLERVREAFAAAGRSDAEIVLVTDGLFTVTLYGLAEPSFDEQGDPVPGDLDRIADELRAVGTLTRGARANPLVTGNISQWVAGGGIEALKGIFKIARLDFRERICGEENEPPEGMSQELWLVERCNNPAYYQEQATDIDPDNLTDAFASTVETSPYPVVNVVFDDEGADEFFKLTERVSLRNDRLSIYLDDEELIAAGVDQSVGGIAGGRAIIEGRFTAERARTIAIQIRSGALPVDLVLIQERTVDATLGDDSLEKSLIAGGVGLVLLLIFMVVYYKIPGLVAAVALVMYTALLLAIFKGIPVTLTLSGAAAIVLSLGFAVDANILIAERVKEELRTGRTLVAAINEGFNRAWPSIRDGNISTIITAVVLFWFGDRFSTSIMQGFALTLGIGVLLSMFTAFFVSRLMLRVVAGTKLGQWQDLFVPVRDTVAADGSQESS